MNPETTYAACPCRSTVDEKVVIVVTFDDYEQQTYRRVSGYRFDADAEWVSILNEKGEERARINARRILSIVKAVDR